MYSLLIDTYIQEPSEREYLFNAIETSELISICYICRFVYQHKLDHSVSTIYSLLILHIVKMHIAIYCSIVALTCSLDNCLINFHVQHGFIAVATNNLCLRGYTSTFIPRIAKMLPNFCFCSRIRGDQHPRAFSNTRHFIFITKLLT